MAGARLGTFRWGRTQSPTARGAAPHGQLLLAVTPAPSPGQNELVVRSWAPRAWSYPGTRWLLTVPEPSFACLEREAPAGVGCVEGDRRPRRKTAKHRTSGGHRQDRRGHEEPHDVPLHDPDDRLHPADDGARDRYCGFLTTRWSVILPWRSSPERPVNGWPADHAAMVLRRLVLRLSVLLAGGGSSPSSARSRVSW
jgi:hypothetical protein